MATLTAGLNILTANTVAVNDPTGTYVEKDVGNANEVGAFFWAAQNVEVHGLDVNSNWVLISTTSQTQKFVNISWQTYSKIQLRSATGSDVKVRAFHRISTGVAEKTIAVTRVDKVSNIPDVADYSASDSGKLATIDATGNVVFQNAPSSNAPVSTDGRFPSITGIDTSEVLFRGDSTPETLIELTGAGFEPDSKIYMFSSAAVAADYENLTNFETGLLDSIAGDNGVVDDPTNSQTTFSSTDTTVMGWSETNNEFGGVRAFGYKNPTTMVLSLKATEALYGAYSLLVVNSNGNKALYSNCLTVGLDSSWSLTLTSVTPAFAQIGDSETFTITGTGYDNDTSWHLFKENSLARNLIGSDLEETGTRTGGSISPVSDSHINGTTFTATGALDCTGTSSRVDLDNPENYRFGTGDFTMSFWLKKSTASTNWDTIFSCDGYNNTSLTLPWIDLTSATASGTSSNNTGAASSTDSDINPGGFSWTRTAGHMKIFATKNNVYNFFLQTSMNVCDGQWRHFTVRRKGDRIDLYVDGTLDGSILVAGLDFNYPITGLSLADRNPAWPYGSSYPFDGKLEQFCVWSRALSRGEIEQLAEAYDTSTISFAEVDKSNVANADYSFTTDPSSITEVTTSPGTQIAGLRGDKYSIVAKKGSQTANLDNSITIGDLSNQAVISLTAWETDSYPGSGVSVLDLTPNYNDGTLTNHAHWVNEPNVLPAQDTTPVTTLLNIPGSLARGLIGASLEETGTATNASLGAVADPDLTAASALTLSNTNNSKVELTDNTGDFDFGTGDFAISLWINTTNASSQSMAYIWKFYDGGGVTGNLNIRLMPSASGYVDGAAGKLLVESNGGGESQGYAAFVINSVVDDGNWHHLVIQRKGGTIATYIDAVESDITYYSGNKFDNPRIVGNASWTPVIGNGHASYKALGGKVEQVCAWKRGLAPDEIRVLYTGVEKPAPITTTATTDAMLADAGNSLNTGLTFSNAQEDQTGSVHTPKAVIADRTYGDTTCLNSTFYAGASNGEGSYHQPAGGSDWATGTDDFSISFWVKGNAAHKHGGLNRRIFRNASHSNNNNNHLQILVADQDDVDINGNSIPMGAAYVYTSGTGVKIGSKSSIINGKYNHFVLTRESDLFKIYVNGVLESQNTFSGVNITGTRPHFGSWSAVNQTGILWGSLGQICFWKDRAITESEVQKLYCGTTFSTTAVANTSTIDSMFTKGDAITNDLVAANMEDLLPINTAGDHSWITPGTLSNTTYANDGITATGVLTLDSSNNEHRDLPLSTDWILGKSDYTWSCWVKTTTFNSDSASRRIYSSVAEDNSGAYGNHIDKFQVFLNTADGTVRAFDSVDLVQSTTNVADGNWHHICYVKDYNTATSLDRSSLYIDGVLEAQADLASSRNYDRPASNGPRIGSYSRTAGNFDGQIEQMCLWKRPLSQSEVYQLMAQSPIKNVKSFQFDGNTDYIKIDGSLSTQSLTNDLSLAVWIKMPPGEQAGIIGNETSGYRPGCFGLNYDDNGQNKLAFWRGNGTTTNWTRFYSTNAVNIDDDQWHMLAITCSGNDWKMYVDNTLVGSVTATQTVASVENGDIYIGINRWQIGQSLQTKHNLEGNIGEVHVWNHAVSESDLSDFYNDTADKYTNGV